MKSMDLKEAREIARGLPSCLGAEEVDIRFALDRVLAEDIRAGRDIPEETVHGGTGLRS